MGCKIFFFGTGKLNHFIVRPRAFDKGLGFFPATSFCAFVLVFSTKVQAVNFSYFISYSILSQRDVYLG